MDSLRHDVAVAFRSLVRDRAFSLSAAGTLALGVGALTALASVVGGALLAPLPYRDPQRLVTILHGWSVSGPVSPADFEDLRHATRSFTGMAAAQAWGANLTAEGRTERVPALQVTGTLFELLGVPAQIGRAIGEPDVAAQARVVVIAHRLWVRRFGADPAVLGRSVVINGEAHRVIGVMPPAFRVAPFWQTRAEAWVPLRCFGCFGCGNISRVATLTPEQLKMLRDRLLHLHKTLLDADRAAYERAYGPVGSSGEWLQLVLGHEHFVWLRPFSGLIVRIDEWLASDDRLADEQAAVMREADRLTSISGSTEQRALRYRKAIDRSADVAVAHASARELLDNTRD